MVIVVECNGKNIDWEREFNLVLLLIYFMSLGKFLFLRFYGFICIMEGFLSCIFN